MRKLIVLLSVLALVAAACGGGDDEAELTTTGRTPAPAADQTPDQADQQADDGDAPAPGGQDAPAAPGEEVPQQPEEAPPAADPGQPNRPRAGTYVYDLSGESSDPLNPAGPPRRYSDDAEVQSEISWDGDIQTVETTTSEEAGRTTTRSRWSDDKVELLSLRIQTPGGDFGCVFDPPILAANLPIQPGSLPLQTWECDDSDGSGQTEITVEGQEDVQDATGRTWSTWQVFTTTQFDFGQVRGNQEATAWLSPDLGTDIRSQGTQDGEFGGPVGAQSFSSEQESVLKRYPS